MTCKNFEQQTNLVVPTIQKQDTILRNSVPVRIELQITLNRKVNSTTMVKYSILSISIFSTPPVRVLSLCIQYASNGKVLTLPSYQIPNTLPMLTRFNGMLCMEY